MRTVFSPGFLTSLQNQLLSLPVELLETVNRHGGLETCELLNLVVSTQSADMLSPDLQDADDILQCDYKKMTNAGMLSANSGETALCIIASGRSSDTDKPLSMLRMKNTLTSLLGMKLCQASSFKTIWIIIDPRMRPEIEQHMTDFMGSYDRSVLVDQHVSFYLTPDKRLDEVNGVHNLHTCGSGDALITLESEGILDRFRTAGGKNVVFCDVSKPYVFPAHAIIGHHIDSGLSATYEITSRIETECGYVLCRYEGWPRLIHTNRIDHTDVNDENFHFIGTGVTVCNVEEKFDRMNLPWHRVRKNVMNRISIGYERDLEDITMRYRSRFIMTPRTWKTMTITSQASLILADEESAGNSIDKI